jgi:hypothetical protein
MYSSNAKHFTYGNIPGSGKGWTLDVCAMTRTDANEYIKAIHRGGKFIGQNVKASCGAITQAAQNHLRERLEIWMNEQN